MNTEYDIRINSCMLSDCKPTWKWNVIGNGFDDYDIWAVFRGRGNIYVNNREFLIERGSCMLLPPHSQIQAKHDENNPLLVRNVHFSILKADVEIFPYGLQQRFMDDVMLFEKLLDRVIASVYSDKSDQANTWLRASLIEFLTFQELIDTSAAKAHIKLIREMCVAINDQIEVSLNSFAEKYGYSATYLGKLFHRAMGVSFSNYILNVRINRAKRILRSSEKSISDIAEELGYCDVCFFIKQFGSIAGMSPGQYRKCSFGSKM